MFNKEKVIEKYYYNVLHQKIDFNSEKLSEQIVDKMQKAIDKNKLDEVLNQIEKMVDEKLSNLKNFIPVLFTVVTSVVAFLFATEVGDTETLRGYLFVCGVLLFAFIILITSFFGRPYYQAKEKKVNVEFCPYDMNSYINLSDLAFIEKLKLYAGRELDDVESVRAIFIKQKINEYATRKSAVNIALGIVEVGAVIVTITCIITAIFPQVTK